MSASNLQSHWERVYAMKSSDQVSWTQAVPQTSLDFIDSLNLPLHAPIIDIGGGESHLVDFLLQRGFSNVTVLDISEKAIQRAKSRLGRDAARVKWLVMDITRFEPAETYAFWHDRATFHFLTGEDEAAGYVNTATQSVSGYMLLATFSEKGPTHCSGLRVKQYSEKSLVDLFSAGFEKLNCINVDHLTPFNTVQNFLYCGFKRRSG